MPNVKCRMSNSRLLLAFGIRHLPLTLFSSLDIPCSPCTPRRPLWSDDRAIEAPRRAPRVIEVRRTGGEGELRRGLLVDVDAEARRLPREHVTVLDLGTADEHLLRLRGESTTFVDAEVVVGQLERQLRSVGQRRCVARAVPRGADAKG